MTHVRVKLFPSMFEVHFKLSQRNLQNIQEKFQEFLTSTNMIRFQNIVVSTSLWDMANSTGFI